MQTLRFTDAGESVLEGCAVPFNSRDDYGTTFTADTNFCEGWYPERPLIYHHALPDDDGVMDDTPIGKVTKVWKESGGLMARAILFKGHRLYQRLRQQVQAGLVGLSHAGLPHLVEEGPGRVVRRWPLLEITVTPRPANAHATISFSQFRSHCRAAGIGVPAFPTTMDERPPHTWTQVLQRQELRALERSIARDDLRAEAADMRRWARGWGLVR